MIWDAAPVCGFCWSLLSFCSSEQSATEPHQPITLEHKLCRSCRTCSSVCLECRDSGGGLLPAAATSCESVMILCAAEVCRMLLSSHISLLWSNFGQTNYLRTILQPLRTKSEISLHMISGGFLSQSVAAFLE